jgi:type 1 glutamine amidotransferase
VVTGGHSFEKDFFGLFEGDWLKWAHAETNEEAFAADIRDSFDVVVFYDMSRNLSEEGRQNLTDYVESGKGLVVLHHALADYYNTWPWWWREVVGGRYIDKESSDPQSSYKHDVEFTVRVEAEHPVTHGLSTFRITDETYKNLWISPDVKVLLSTDEKSSDGPVAWISPYQQSRVVAIQLGHDNQAYSNPSFQKLIQQAIEWAR